MRAQLVVLASFLLLAGCVQPAAEERSRAWDAQAGEGAAAAGDLGSPSLVVEERATAQSVVFHEEVRGEPFKPFDDGIRMEGRWEPREATFSFHGVHNTFDEWGRAVPAFVFRYEPMDLVLDSLDFTSDGIEGEAHWEPSITEYLFDAADGRYMGSVDVGSSTRVFSEPEPRSPLPYTGYPALALLVMAIQVQGTADMAVRGGSVSFMPADNDRPVAGECSVYRLEFQQEGAAGDGREEDDEDSRALVCLGADSPLPVWTFMGDDKDAVVMRRDPAPFALPDVAGEVLAPLELPRLPWQELPSLPGLEPVLVPPSGGSDWSATLAERVEALQQSPDFARYQAVEGRTYTSMAWSGLPFGAPFLPGLGALGSYEESTWLEATPGDGMYWADVYSGNHSGPLPRHQAEPRGSEFPGGGFPNMDPSELPPLVPPAEFASAVGAVADVGASPMLMFHVWPAIEGIDWGDYGASWLALGGCFTGDEGKDAGEGYVYMSAVSGRFLTAGVVESSGGGCSTGSSSLELPDGTVLLRPSGSPLPVAAAARGHVLPLPANSLPSLAQRVG